MALIGQSLEVRLPPDNLIGTVRGKTQQFSGAGFLAAKRQTHVAVGGNPRFRGPHERRSRETAIGEPAMRSPFHGSGTPWQQNPRAAGPRLRANAPVVAHSSTPAKLRLPWVLLHEIPSRRWAMPNAVKRFRSRIRENSEAGPRSQKSHDVCYVPVPVPVPVPAETDDKNPSRRWAGACRSLCYGRLTACFSIRRPFWKVHSTRESLLFCQV